MKRHVLLLIIVFVLTMLSACAGVEITYKETAEELASAGSESPMPEPSGQEADVPETQMVEANVDDEVTFDDALSENTLGVDASEQILASSTPEETAATGHDDIQTEAVSAEVPTDNIESASPDDYVEQEEQPTPESGGQPPVLSQYVKAAGLSFDDFDFSQLVLVTADASQADIYCYDKDDNGLWELNEELGYIVGYAGRNGVSTDKREGDGCTPGGLYSLGFAFGNKPEPTTGLEYRAVTEDDYWVDDPNSIYYNQWVEGTDGADWTSSEHLAVNVVSYAYAVVIEYNMSPDTIAGKGSAIFIHVGNKPTSGCVTMTEENLLGMLKWLASDQNPSVLIVAK